MERQPCTTFFAIAAGALLVLLTQTGKAIAQVVAPAPEVDLGSMASALAVLAAGGTVLADRIRCNRIARS